MEISQGYVESAALASIPPVDGCSFTLLRPADTPDDARGDAYLAQIDAMGNREVIAFIDMSCGVAYRCDCMASDACPNPRDAGDEPLVKLVGDIAGDTGQLVIKQPRVIGDATVVGIACPNRPPRSPMPWCVPCRSADAVAIWAHP